jgi:hypothetical protein
MVDEADLLIFADPFKFKKALQKSSAICFTGTPPDSKENSLEQKIYSHLDLKTYNYWPKSLAKPQNTRLIKTV